jgi:hypothetical protein
MFHTTDSLEQCQSLLSSAQSNYSSVEHDSVSITRDKSILTHVYWQSVFDRFSTSVYLENKGSVARDHLGMINRYYFLYCIAFAHNINIFHHICLPSIANERTYLAWLRTSLSTIAVGIGKKSLLYNIYIYITKYILSVIL